MTTTKKKAEHTPGDWAVNWRSQEDDSQYFDIEDYNGNTVCKVESYDASEEFQEEGKANARLIAAAPDLLAVCENAVRILEHNCPHEALPAIELLKHEIAKAKGE